MAIARALVSRPELLLADEPTRNLDSRTAEEVLRLLERLNQQEGLTVLIVTHDENVACHAQRIIRMKDGVIVEEGPPARARPATRAEATTLPPPPGAPLHGGLRRLKNLARTARMALRALRRNVMRSMLTCLGIVIGIAAVIAMMELGGGSSRSIQQAVAGARDILRQFLIEAVVLCLAGGIVGILLGRGSSIAVTSLLHWPTLLSLPAIVASVAVSCTVGTVFGFYPAWKASRLDPIEALRYE